MQIHRDHITRFLEVGKVPPQYHEEIKRRLEKAISESGNPDAGFFDSEILARVLIHRIPFFEFYKCWDEGKLWSENVAGLTG
jgi:hypothetical protein